MRLLKIIQSYFTGLDRNFKIIGYGNVPSYLISKAAEEKYSHLRRTRAPRLSLLNSMARETIFEKISPFEQGMAQIAFCGASANNEREFSYAHALLPRVLGGVSYDRSNNVSYWKVDKKTDIAISRTFRTIIFLTLCVFSLRVKASADTLPTVARYMSQYTKHFLRYYAHFSKLDKPSLPLLAVVANDHTDNPVAFSMIMKALGVSRMYVQHAEVTRLFPALDFEFSILRNEVSLETYRSIGPIRGAVLIAPREERTENLKEILNPTPEPVSIVIYLSSVFSNESLQKTIAELRANPHVASVSLKRHPRSKDTDFLFLNGIAIHPDTPDYPHIAIVPNSSVVIELLHRGIKVFQYFELDDIANDYYGFVADGITPKIDTYSLRDKFWMTSFYDTTWFSRFRVYDPSIDDSWKKDRERFSTALIDRLESRLDQAPSRRCGNRL